MPHCVSSVQGLGCPPLMLSNLQEVLSHSMPFSSCSPCVSNHLLHLSFPCTSLAFLPRRVQQWQALRFVQNLKARLRYAKAAVAVVTVPKGSVAVRGACGDSGAQSSSSMAHRLRHIADIVIETISLEGESNHVLLLQLYSACSATWPTLSLEQSPWTVRLLIYCIECYYQCRLNHMADTLIVRDAYRCNP